MEYVSVNASAVAACEESVNGPRRTVSGSATYRSNRSYKQRRAVRLAKSEPSRWYETRLFRDESKLLAESRSERSVRYRDSQANPVAIRSSRRGSLGVRPSTRRSTLVPPRFGPYPRVARSSTPSPSPSIA
jgi:hypothetical protein